MGGNNLKNSLVKVLNRRDRKFFDKFSHKIKNDLTLQNEVCDFLRKEIGEDLCKYSDDRRFQVCLDYLIIGLVSGDITRRKLENFLK